MYVCPLSDCVSLFANYRTQSAVLVRSSREIAQTVRIDCHSFLSRVRISVRLRLIDENPQKRAQKPSVQLIASDT